MQVGVLLFDLLPQFLNWVVVRRIGRQLENLKPRSLLDEEGFGLGTGMIACSILNQQTGLWRLLPYTSEKGNVRGGVQTSFLALIKETSHKVFNQAEDFIAFALA